MEKPKYNIGDVVYVGEWKSYERWITCPDCGGGKTLKVTLFNGEEFVIPCAGCACGFDPPRGVVKSYGYEASVKELIIQGMELSCSGRNKNQWEYRVGYEFGENSCSYRTIPECEIFLNEQDAQNFAIAKGRQLQIDQDARFFQKEKSEHTWAWHVTYHRREIKRAERDLEYHIRKLGIAKTKSKEKDNG